MISMTRIMFLMTGIMFPAARIMFPMTGIMFPMTRIMFPAIRRVFLLGEKAGNKSAPGLPLRPQTAIGEQKVKNRPKSLFTSR
jgi:hypothetical protein